MWFLNSYYGPLQCIFLTLIYLQCFTDSSEIPLARYYIDEIIEHIVAHYQVSQQPSSEAANPDSESDAAPPKARLPLAIQVLVDIHSRLD